MIDWKHRQHEASVAMEGREEKLDELYEEIEKDMMVSTCAENFVNTNLLLDYLLVVILYTGDMTLILHYGPQYSLISCEIQIVLCQCFTTHLIPEISSNKKTKCNFNSASQIFYMIKRRCCNK